VYFETVSVSFGLACAKRHDDCDARVDSARFGPLSVNMMRSESRWSATTLQCTAKWNGDL